MSDNYYDPGDGPLRDDIDELTEKLAERDAEIERLRIRLNNCLDIEIHNAVVGKLNEEIERLRAAMNLREEDHKRKTAEIERLRKELAEKDDYIRTVSRPIGAHSYD